ncbi:hypothetical protein [Flavobacterium branchiophilum]|nr:hypothetical protein [Flavobacterium branchiophilum]
MKTIKIKQIFLSMFMLLSLGTWGQNQWFFGSGAGLDFTNASSSNPPVFLSGNLMQAMEGCAMGFDINKKIVIYTDGRDVWWINNGVHTLITNSTNQLKSSTSSTNAATIVPINCNTYVIFTVNMRDQNDTLIAKNSLYYSIVTLNGNLMPTISNPQYLYGDASTNIIFSEKLAVYKMSNKNEYWIVVHNFSDKSNVDAKTFISFKVDSNIINTRPTAILSNVGQHHRTDFFDGVGQMKISQKGNFIAYANKNYVEIFKFNVQNGKVEARSEPSMVFRAGNNYGIEFSKDESLLYYSNLDSQANGGIYKVPLNNVSGQTRLNVNSTGSVYNYGALQFGPDDALYCGKGAAGNEKNEYILRIVNPADANPSYNLIKVINGTPSSTNRVLIGLPTIIVNQDVCNGSDTTTPVGADCNCWKPIGTKYNGLDLDKLGVITPFLIDKNNSVSIAAKQVLDVALNHVYPEYVRDSNNNLNIRFVFAMRPDLKSYLESYLRYLNGTFKCVNMIRVSYSINDVTGVTGLPNGTEITPPYNLEMYIDNNGIISYNNVAAWNSYTFTSYKLNNVTVSSLPQIGKEYKTGITIVALSRGGTNDFEDTKKCGFNWECSTVQAFYSWVPSSKKMSISTIENSNSSFYEVLDKNNKVLKTFAPKK